jgi:adenylosuccinate synthase
MSSEAILVLGAQFGDEGKGKLIDIVAAERDIWYVEVILGDFAPFPF